MKVIEELEKTKNVLTYRTAEMRKGLEPKEAQIDKLKNEVMKLEIELEASIQKSNERQKANQKKEDEMKSVKK